MENFCNFVKLFSFNLNDQITASKISVFLKNNLTDPKHFNVQFIVRLWANAKLDYMKQLCTMSLN